MDKQRVRQLHHAMNAALEKLAEEHGMVFEKRGMRFDDTSITGRVIFKVKGSEAVETNRTAECLGTQLRYGDRVRVGSDPRPFKVVSFTSRGSVIITDDRGKSYRAKLFSCTKIEEPVKV
jgi:hypothetical protein